MKSWRIGQRLGIGIGVGVAFLIAFGWLLLRARAVMNASLQKIGNERSIVVGLTNEVLQLSDLYRRRRRLPDRRRVALAESNGGDERQPAEDWQRALHCRGPHERGAPAFDRQRPHHRSEEHTSELQSPM